MLDQEIKDWIAASASSSPSIGRVNPEDLRFTLIHAADRSVYRIDLPDSERFLVLKIWKTDSLGNQLKKTSSSISGEFEKTQLAFQTWSAEYEDSSSITEPLAVSEERSALLLTGCPGDDFSKYLNKRLLIWPVARSAISRRFTGAGNWLGRFHAASQHMENTVEFLDIRRSHLVRMLGDLYDVAEGSSLENKVLAKFDRRVSELDALPVALIHGNYALRNLLVTDSTVSAIDFEESRQECSLYDVGQFFAEILVRGFVPTLSRRSIDQSISDFLAGYSEKLEVDTSLLDAYVGYHLVAFYHEHARRRSLNAISRMRRDHIKRELIRWMQ